MTEKLDKAIQAGHAAVQPGFFVPVEDYDRTFAQALIADLLKGLDGPLKDQEQPGLAAAFNGGRMSVVAEFRAMVGLDPPDLPEDLKKWAENIIRTRAGIGGE